VVVRVTLKKVIKLLFDVLTFLKKYDVFLNKR
jgi:hypothetical protein